MILNFGSSILEQSSQSRAEIGSRDLLTEHRVLAKAPETGTLPVDGISSIHREFWSLSELSCRDR